MILDLLINKTKIITIKDISIAKIKNYFPKNEILNLLHAATAYQENATIISNDKHFERLKETGLVNVWSISEAISQLLP